MRRPRIGKVGLTPRECEVLLWLAKGETFQWIAERRMNIAAGSAKTLAVRAYRKMGVVSQDEAVAVHQWHRGKPLSRCYRYQPLVIHSSTGDAAA